MTSLDHVSTPNGLGPLAAVSVLAKRVQEIEEAPSEAEITRRELRLAIREAHAAGHTLRAIGEAAGISHQRVAQLLKKSD